MRKLVLGLVVLVAAAAAWSLLHPIFTPDYIFRVLVRQDANTSDYLWKKQYPIEPSDEPVSSTTPASSSPRVPELLDRLVPAGGSIEDYLEASSTRAFLVSLGGELVFEAYPNGGARNQTEPTFSVSKSILSLFLGWLHQRGELPDMDTRLTELVELRATDDANLARVTLRDLLDMRSGVAWDGTTAFPFVNADPPLVYYASDIRAVLRDRTRSEAPPGTFEYNDYNPNLLALALENHLGENPLEAFGRFWRATGSDNPALWSTDRHGFAYWESGFVATGADLIKLGRAVLSEGRNENGELLVDPEWIDRIFDYSPAEPLDDYDGSQWSYRNGWWIILRPDGRHDAAAIGRFGQFIYVSPRADLVIVRLGTDQDPPSDSESTRFFYSIASALEQTATAGASRKGDPLLEVAHGSDG